MVMSATDYVICLNGHVCCSGKPHIVAQDEKYKELFGDRASKVYLYMSINTIILILKMEQ